MAIEKIYIFNYGSLIALLEFHNNHVEIKTSFDSESLGHSMDLLARLMLAHNNSTRKHFHLNRFAGSFGREYIVLIKHDSPRQSASILGLARKLANELDKLDIMDVDTASYRVVDILRKNKFLDKNIYKMN